MTLTERYRANYDRICADDLGHSIQTQAHLQAKADRDVHYLGYPRGLDILELGVGRGTLALMLCVYNSVVAVDIARGYLDRLRDTGIETVQDDAETLRLGRRFDLVIATDILEHVLDPDKLLDTVTSHLKPAGRILLRVPFRENLKGYAHCPYEFVHLRNFDRAELWRLLARHGLVADDYWFTGFMRYKWSLGYIPQWMGRMAASFKEIGVIAKMEE